MREAASQAHDLGLIVNAGHGINYNNISEIRLLPHLHELNIGHSIISRALFTGIFEEAVREMKNANERMNLTGPLPCLPAASFSVWVQTSLKWSASGGVMERQG